MPEFHSENVQQMLLVFKKFWHVHERNETVLYQWLPAMKLPVASSEQSDWASLNSFTLLQRAAHLYDNIEQFQSMDSSVICYYLILLQYLREIQSVFLFSFFFLFPLSFFPFLFSFLFLSLLLSFPLRRFFPSFFYNYYEDFLGLMFYYKISFMHSSSAE